MKTRGVEDKQLQKPRDDLSLTTQEIKTKL